MHKTAIIITAHLYPMATSAAGHMSDLAEHMNKDQEIHVITQSRTAFGKKTKYGYVYGIYNPFIRSEKLTLRFFGELFFPILIAATIGIYLRFALRNYDLIAYSPTTLQFPLMLILKKNRIKQFLIVRDIFPEWLADVKIVKFDGLVYKFLKYISHFQYGLSEVIGVQALNDLNRIPVKHRHKVIILNSFNTVDVNQTKRDENKTFLDIACFGTFGRAQNWKLAIKVINCAMKKESKIRFHFYGSANKNLVKDLFLEEIQDRIFIKQAVIGDEFFSKIRKIDIGFFALNEEIKSSNIPGKFVSYCKYGIPSFGICAPCSEISKIVKKHRLGMVSSVNNIESAASILCQLTKEYKKFSQEDIRRFFQENHSVEYASGIINRSLKSANE